MIKNLTACINAIKKLIACELYIYIF